MTEKSNATWFSQGSDVENFFPERDASGKGGKYPPARFWLKEGEERKVIFLDDTTFRFHEHKIYMKAPGEVKGRFYYFTCLAQTGATCPLCEEAASQPDNEISIRAKPVVAYTILDLTPYTAKDGSVRQYSRRVFVAGEQSAKKLMITRNNQIEKDKEMNGIDPKENPGLKMAKVSVARSGGKVPSTGDSFEFWSRIDDITTVNGLEKITDEELQPVDYMQEFTPKSLEEVKSFVTDFRQARGRGTSTSTTSTSADYS